MNILYIANSTSTSGGDNKSLLTLLHGIRSKGANVFIVVPDNNGIYKQLILEGFIVSIINYRMDVYPNAKTINDLLLFVPRLLCRRLIEYMAEKKISQLCQKWDIDLIHSNVSVLSCGLFAAKKANIPHIAHIREYVDQDFGLHPYPNKKAFYKRLNGPRRYTICITRGIQKYHHLTGNNSIQIYNGILNSKKEKESIIYSKEKYFLYVGRIEKAKGLMQLIEAYANFINQHTKGYSLKIAGEISDPNYAKRIKLFIESHNITNKIEFLGPRKDINTLMSNAQALIVPSVFEAFGRCLPEAMVNNCLTIGHNTGGTKEQYDNGLQECKKEIGLRYSTTSELSSCLSRVFLAQDYEFSEMKQRAKQVAEKLYSADSYVNQVFSFYKKILNKY